MRVALLSAGPSLPRHWSADKQAEYDAVVAINCAGWLFEADWQVCADRHALVPWIDGRFHDKIMPAKDVHLAGKYQGLRRPPPRVGFCITVGNVTTEALREQYPDKQIIPLPGDDLGRVGPYSIIPAFRLAKRLADGGGIDVYGWDCATGQRDVCGQNGEFRAFRWEREVSWIGPMWEDRYRLFSDMPQELRDILATRKTWVRPAITETGRPITYYGTPKKKFVPRP